MSEAEELQPLYLAIGYVIVKWSFVEAALDFSVSTIYVDCGGNSLRKQMPKFLKDKCKFIVEATTKIPMLAPFKARAENVMGRIIQIKDTREYLAHSVLTRTTHEDGVYSFARLNAKEHNHALSIWKFDVRAFPSMADKLEALVTEAQDFAHSLEVAFHK
jgi:hypothetical protein